MKKLTALLLSLVLLLGLAACSGGGDSDPNLGVYSGQSVEMFGESSPMSEVYPGENKMELKADGKADLTLDGDTIPCEWSLDGTALTVTIEGQAQTGTLEEGVLRFNFMGLMDMVFAKDGAAPQGGSGTAEGGKTEAPEEEPTAVGYFKAHSMVESGETFDREMLETLGLADFLYVILDADGSGRIALGDGETPITWDEKSLHSEGVALPYVLDGDLFTIELEGMTFTFERSDEEPPAPVIPGVFPAAFAASHEGDWHGMMKIADGTGHHADVIDSQMEVLARFVFHEDGTCTPYLAAALSGGSNFEDLAVTYNEFGDLMELEGFLANAAIVEGSNLYAMDGLLMMELYVDDGEGNTMTIYANLRRLDESWDYDYDDPALPQGAVDFYMGKSMEELVTLFGLDPADLPAASGSGAAPVAGQPTENPGFSGPTAEYNYNDKGMILFQYPSDTFTFERKFGVDTLKANDDSLKITFVADWGMDDYAEQMAGYDKYVSESGGVKEEGLAYAGFPATRCTWESVIGDISMETYILFGEGHGDYVGINVIATASSQANLDANKDVIEAVLHSVHLQ